MRFIFCIQVAIGVLILPLKGNSQAEKESKQIESKSASKGMGLFESDNILQITLRGNVKEVLNDRYETPQYHPLLALYKGEDSIENSIYVDVKTRGHFRRLKENCNYPPLLLHFAKNESEKSPVFKGQDKCKLVVPCQGEDYVVKEWLVYKLFNIITPKSFNARLVKMKFDDTKTKKITAPFYGILLEEDKKMAKRNKSILIERKTRPEQTETEAFLTMAVFEYLIGNTDWSVQFFQNTRLIAKDSFTIPTVIPYDFDHSGMVNAPYAYPPQELFMRSVLERRYRGYCIKDMKKFDGVIATYNRLKEDIYRLYNECPYIDAKYKQTTVKYLNEFYATINNPTALLKEFGYPCDPNGTGNVVIKGLKEN